MIRALIALILLTSPALAQSSGCYGINCPNSLGDRIIPLPQPRPDDAKLNDATRRHDYTQSYGGGRARSHNATPEGLLR